MLLPVRYGVILLVFTRVSTAKTTRYEYVVPREAVVIDQLDTVDTEIVIIANDTIGVYGSIAHDQTLSSSANESFVFESNGTDGRILATLYSLDDSGTPLICNTSVTITSNRVSNGGFLVRLYSDIKDVNYSFTWFAKQQESVEIILHGGERPAIVTILDTTYQDTSTFVYLDSVYFTNNSTMVYWDKTSTILKNPTSYDSRYDITHYSSSSPLTCSQFLPGRLKTFRNVGETTYLMFRWADTTYAKQIFFADDYLVVPTLNYGVPSVEQNLDFPILVPFPSLVQFNTEDVFNITYTSDGPQSQMTGPGLPQLFGYDFMVQFVSSSVGGTSGGSMFVAIGPQTPCSFLGTGPMYTCKLEFYLTGSLDEAIRECSVRNGSLPIFHNYGDVSILHASTQTSFLNPPVKANYKVWLGFKDGQWLDGSNFTGQEWGTTADLSNSTSIVYDRETGIVMEWPGPAGMMCQYRENSHGLCSTYNHLGYQYYGNFPMCVILLTYANYNDMVNGLNGCSSQLTSSASLPEPQSYRENELIYNFAKANKLFDFNTYFNSQPKPAYVLLNYQGAVGQNCKTWPNSGQKMDFANFVDGVDMNNCNKRGMCMVMRLETAEAGKWEFAECYQVQIGICVLKGK